MKQQITLIFSFFFIALSSRAEIQIIGADHYLRSTVIRNKTIENAFARFPIFKDGRVTIERGGMTKADLIEAWQRRTGRENIDSYYYENNQPVYYEIDRQFKDAYFSISRSVTGSLVQALTYEGIGYDDRVQLYPSTYVLKVGSRPATYRKNGKDAMLVMTTMALCVANGQVTATASPPKLFSRVTCPGGRTVWLAQFNTLEYDPLCNGGYCQTPNDVVDSVQTRIVDSFLVALPNVRHTHSTSF